MEGRGSGIREMMGRWLVAWVIDRVLGLGTSDRGFGFFPMYTVDA